MKNEEFAAFGLLPPTVRLDPPCGPRDVASLPERAAVHCPDNEALVDLVRRMSFAEFARAVNAAANLLSAAGVRTGDRIAASLGNEAGIVIAFFAAMRLGVVWVGINKVLPVNDKRYILAHSGAKLLLTDAAIAPQIDALRGDLPDLDNVWLIDDPVRDGGWAGVFSAGGEAVAPRPDIDPFAPAAIMYTSGTTGVPKGVVHSQHNMIVVSAATLGNGMLAPDARRGSALPLTITNVMILGPISAFWNFKPFLFGPSIKIPPLIAWMRAENIGNIAFVPTMVYDLLEADLELPSGMKLGCGGAPLPDIICQRFRDRHGYDIQTSYGLTEAPTVVALSGDRPRPQGASGIGVSHLDVTIRDTDGNVLPTGEVGEVCIGPVQTGPWANVYTPPLGYWREPEKTAALLKGGVLHTSDHGRLDAEGWLYIADRSSELILRGGSNVYPAEIERVLHTHPDVADCAVVGKPDLRMGMLTVACIQPARPDIDLVTLEADLRAHCLNELSRYKVPDQWRFMDAMPRNAMGKVVKPQLRELVA